jgi:dTDP-4-amino-4,6-dideoxygalactose transaminase
LIYPHVSKNVKHAYHLYPLQIKFDTLKISKKVFFEKLKAKSILLQVHYVPVHLQPYYRKTFGFKPGDFVTAEQFYEREFSIPMYPSLSDVDLDYIAKTIIDTIKEAK